MNILKKNLPKRTGPFVNYFKVFCLLFYCCLGGG